MTQILMLGANGELARNTTRVLPRDTDATLVHGATDATQVLVAIERFKPQQPSLMLGCPSA